MKNLAFQKGAPSIFVLTSPFQTLCALNALHEFEITDYLFYLALDEDIRNQQLFRLLDSHGISYHTVYMNQIDKKYMLKSCLPHKSKYQRLFIGDIRNRMQYYVGLSLLGNRGSIVYLDDGNDNIFLLKGFRQCLTKSLLKNKLLVKTACLFRLINDNNNIYTVYGDIKNNHYNIRLNDFKRLVNNHQHAVIKDVFFIGTNYARYCEPGNLSLSMVKKNLETMLHGLKEKYGNEYEIYYIAHGRDMADFPKEYCKCYSIHYIRPEITVELFISQLGYQPYYILGYTSTALYNIKLLFPKTIIKNIIFKVEPSNDFIRQIYVVTDYYERHGIPTIEFVEG